MANFYKISKIDAEKIGIFTFNDEEQFNPFCGEQTDGTFLVSVDLVNALKENENIKKVDFSKLTIIEEKDIKNKIIDFKAN